MKPLIAIMYSTTHNTADWVKYTSMHDEELIRLPEGNTRELGDVSPSVKHKKSSSVPQPITENLSFVASGCSKGAGVKKDSFGRQLSSPSPHSPQSTPSPIPIHHIKMLIFLFLPAVVTICCVCVCVYVCV